MLFSAYLNTFIKDEVVEIGYGKQMELDQLIQFIESAPLDEILKKIDFNHYSIKHESTLLSYTAQFYFPLLTVILRRVPEKYLDFSKLTHEALIEIICKLCLRDDVVLIKKFKNKLDLNAICSPIKGATVFFIIIEILYEFPHAMLIFLENTSLDEVNFKKNAYDAPLVLIIKSALKYNFPSLLNILLEKIQFRDLEFTDGIFDFNHLDCKYRYGNVVEWLATTSYAHYVDKFLDLGIKQGEEIFHHLLANKNHNENVNVAQIPIFEQQIKKLEDYIKLSSAPAHALKLAQFYERLGLHETTKEFVKRLCFDHPYRAAIYDLLAQSMVYNFAETSHSEPNNYKSKLLKAVKYSLEGSPALRKQLSLTFIYQGKACSDVFPSQTKEPFFNSLADLKAPIAKEEKKLILNALSLIREREELQTKPFDN
ncbi:MAG TPA: hypothetical protein VFP93_03200, partial [Gammaproteobacteria bacterium]|nr:hypothetical protein [Gammaproteobacteria bacterium]